MPKNLREIGAFAFEGCERLTSINIPGSVSQIQGDAFAYCGLTSVTLPESVDSVGAGAFHKNNLRNITILNPYCSLGIGAFYNFIDDEPTTSITGYDNSTAHMYAIDKDLRFISLGEIKYKMGDMNSDNEINALDASLALTAYALSAIDLAMA